MIISYCVPVKNRNCDLKAVMPSLIKAANASPPVEIMILDYNSSDDLAEYIEYVKENAVFRGGSMVSYKKYSGGKYFRIAHARNLSVLASRGTFLVLSCADQILGKNYFEAVRELLESGDYVWLHPHKKGGTVLGCSRNEFINAGGYDEKFIYYGKEDKDLMLRLERRGGKFKQVPLNLIVNIPTPKLDKHRHISRALSVLRAEKHTKAIYDENIANNILVANLEGWGSWE